MSSLALQNRKRDNVLLTESLDLSTCRTHSLIKPSTQLSSSQGCIPDSSSACTIQRAFLHICSAPLFPGLFHPRYRTLHLPLLNLIRFLPAHFSRPSKFLSRVAKLPNSLLRVHSTKLQMMLSVLASRTRTGIFFHYPFEVTSFYTF